MKTSGPHIFEQLLALIAWCISRVRINRITFDEIDGQAFVLKRRTLISPVLIMLGNCVLFFRRVPVEVLHYRKLIGWDRQVQALSGSIESRETSQGLLVSKKPGRPLSELIVEEDIQRDRVIEVLSLALRELYRLHQILVETNANGDAESVLFSHGDASISNVLYEAETNQICWFDYDLRHDLRQSANLRHADDLRGFLFTSKKCLSIFDDLETLLPEFEEAMRLAYPAEEVWLSLEEITSSRWFAMDLFHRAQLFRL